MSNNNPFSILENCNDDIDSDHIIDDDVTKINLEKDTDNNADNNANKCIDIEKVVDKNYIKIKNKVQKNKVVKRYNTNTYNKKKIYNLNKNRMICCNILNNNTCHYGSKCLYSHSYDEQFKDPIRKIAYKYIQEECDLSTVSLIKNKDLFHALKQLTKMCKKCFDLVCPGGYNCNYGVFDKKYQVCYSNLMTGRCLVTNCQMVHLTNKGLVPYNLQLYNGKNTNITKKTNYIKIKRKLNDNSEYNGGIKCVSLDSFLNNSRTNVNNMSDSESDNEFEKKYKYINNLDEDSDNESIFIIDNIKSNKCD